ncbi:MAG: hypothetical protein ACE5DX_00515 [Candidatus Dojkabacteria bacterium]
MDLKKLIDDYLGTQRLMAFATYGDYPWIANLYYVHDKDLNLYFLSKPTREHCEALEVNDLVSAAIADSSQPIHKSQKGIQLNGTSKSINSISKLKWMFEMWNKLVAGEKGERLSNPKQFLEAGRSKVYKITPKRIKFFNTELWPEKQTQVLNL